MAPTSIETARDGSPGPTPSIGEGATYRSTSSTDHLATAVGAASAAGPSSSQVVGGDNFRRQLSSSSSKSLSQFTARRLAQSATLARLPPPSQRPTALANLGYIAQQALAWKDRNLKRQLSLQQQQLSSTGSAGGGRGRGSIIMGSNSGLMGLGSAGGRGGGQNTIGSHSEWMGVGSPGGSGSNALMYLHGPVSVDSTSGLIGRIPATLAGTTGATGSLPLIRTAAGESVPRARAGESALLRGTSGESLPSGSPRGAARGAPLRGGSFLSPVVHRPPLMAPTDPTDLASTDPIVPQPGG
jgi:hypothetical protein